MAGFDPNYILDQWGIPPGLQPQPEQPTSNFDHIVDPNTRRMLGLPPLQPQDPRFTFNGGGQDPPPPAAIPPPPGGAPPPAGRPPVVPPDTLPPSGGTYPWPGRTPGSSGTAIPNPFDQFNNANIQKYNPQEQTEQNRQHFKGWGDALDQDTRDAQNRYQDSEGNYQDWLINGQGGYNQILAGQGGYSEDEQTRLLQQKLIESGMATQEELDSLGLSASEMQSILGEPYAARSIFAGQQEGLETSQTEATKRQREAYGSLGRGLNNVAGRESLGVSDTFDPRMMAYINEMAGKFDASLDPAQLGLSPEFLGRYDWTPEDTARFVSQAGRTVGNMGQSARDEMERNAWAAGNVSPMALAAAQTDSRIQSDVAGADAMTNARIAAKQNELNTAKTREQMRLDTSFGLSDRQIATAEQIAGRKLSQGEAYEVMRLQAERDRASRATDAVKTGELTRLETERGVGESEQSLGRYGADKIYDATRYGEAASSDRATQTAANRQKVGEYGLNTRYGQAMPASEALAGRWAGVLGQKKKEEAEGRAALSTQQSRAQEGASTTRQQRIGAAGQSFGNINQATNTSAQADNPWWKTVSTLLGG